MQGCECKQYCFFILDKKQNMPRLAKKYEQDFCNENFQDCARYQMYQENTSKVPSDLIPTDIDRVAEIKLRAH